MIEDCRTGTMSRALIFASGPSFRMPTTLSHLTRIRTHNLGNTLRTPR